MTKNNTVAVEFHRCSCMRMQWIPDALFFSPVSPAPVIRSTPWAPGAEATTNTKIWLVEFYVDYAKSN